MNLSPLLSPTSLKSLLSPLSLRQNTISTMTKRSQHSRQSLQPQYKTALKESVVFMRGSQLRINQMSLLTDQLELAGGQMKLGNFRTFRSAHKITSEDDRIEQIEQSLRIHQDYFSSMKKISQRQRLSNLPSYRSSKGLTNPKIEQYANSPNQQIDGASFSINDPSSRHKTCLDKIITQASQVVEALLPDIQQMKQQDKSEALVWDQLSRDFNRDLEFNPGTWQADKKFQKVKNSLKHMQTEADLPEYFKFCLINSKENLKNAKRDNPEIKETRFLWYQIQKSQKEGNPLSNEVVRYNLEIILKKYQRMKQNQFLSKEKELGWKLNSIKKPKKLNVNEEEYQLLIENLEWAKAISPKQEIKKQLLLSEEKIKYQMRMENIQKQLQKNQFAPSQHEIIRNVMNKIYKVSKVSNTSPNEKQYEISMNDAINAQLQNASQLICLKNQIQKGKKEIQLQHYSNYKTKKNK